MARPILLYNPNCEICNAIATRVSRIDRSGRDAIDERPLPADPGALAAIHPALDIWKAYETIHVVMPDGTLRTGGMAIGEVLRRLPGLGWVGSFADLRVFGAQPGAGLLELGYRTLDAIRPALGCSSCGGGPVAWYLAPLAWVARGLRASSRSPVH